MRAIVNSSLSDPVVSTLDAEEGRSTREVIFEVREKGRIEKTLEGLRSVPGVLVHSVEIGRREGESISGVEGEGPFSYRTVYLRNPSSPPLPSRVVKRFPKGGERGGVPDLTQEPLGPRLVPEEYSGIDTAYALGGVTLNVSEAIKKIKTWIWMKREERARNRVLIVLDPD